LSLNSSQDQTDFNIDSHMEQTPPTIAWQGKFLSIALRDRWEYATRNTRRPAVGIIALTDDRRVVLVEQFRPPVDRRVIELPAGLSGDIAGAENESLQTAAERELLEETGYHAANWTELTRGYSSPGLTDETVVLFLATGLTKSGPGGGDATENIVLHEIPLDEVLTWLAKNNHAADLKLLAALHAAQVHLNQN
jgi:ADP-ribose pyrophosphatase